MNFRTPTKIYSSFNAHRHGHIFWKLLCLFVLNPTAFLLSASRLSDLVCGVLDWGSVCIRVQVGVLKLLLLEAHSFISIIKKLAKGEFESGWVLLWKHKDFRVTGGQRSVSALGEALTWHFLPSWCCCFWSCLSGDLPDYQSVIRLLKWWWESKFVWYYPLSCILSVQILYVSHFLAFHWTCLTVGEVLIHLQGKT